jgi:acetylornithine deacetylase
MYENLITESIENLQKLINTPSVSGNEQAVSQIIEDYLKKYGIEVNRIENNIYAYNKHYDKSKPTLLFNSHLDTVKPNAGWTKDPFKAQVIDNKLYGLGSNDAGAPLVSLLATFIYLYAMEEMTHNIIFSAVAEEENSGRNGMRLLLSKLGKIDLAIVGEPTGMQMAIAEKGLIVLRCQAKGVSGHAARDTGENALYKAVDDIQWFRNFKFEKESDVLGPVKMSVTMVNSGTQHNVVPDRCDYTVDIRTTDTYSNEEVLEIIDKNIKSDYGTPSLSLNPSSIPQDHPLVKIAKESGVEIFGSPTMSDQTFVSAPSVKMGPGMSERSHTSDEYVYLSEIEHGIQTYIYLLEKFLTGKR